MDTCTYTFLLLVWNKAIHLPEKKECRVSKIGNEGLQMPPVIQSSFMTISVLKPMVTQGSPNFKALILRSESAVPLLRCSYLEMPSSEYTTVTMVISSYIPNYGCS